jgi:hypothetical protein
MMKKTLPLLCAVVGLLAGCGTPTTTIHIPVGPDPFVATQSGPNGNLEIFSTWTDQNPGGLPSNISSRNYPRVSYTVYDGNGKLMEPSEPGQTGNGPRNISLPPGSYRITVTTATGPTLLTEVPVIVETGRMTVVYLNGGWIPPANTPYSELVFSPGGFPLGWRAGNPTKS